ncbi:YraN family protein [Klenkia brasiliensis]|uniref:UPF0102 protein SAMN05660324_3526 n=1 Tax=Klenkia brasiliensis TaxID=333142 RepID=A0A1G7WVW0_9ACTN|nr:YraN family protein [Klenkia brasiliensis]SDG76034.1 putative endonuclease [Klenkia brasiliensis]
MQTSRADRRAALGAHGEQLAVDHLTAAGLTVLDRNWRCPRGELDVVAREGDALVFCEVKTRSGTRYGTPLEGVTPAKQARLKQLAGRWLDAHDERAGSLRFDVVGVVVVAGRATVSHLRGAF